MLFIVCTFLIFEAEIVDFIVDVQTFANLRNKNYFTKKKQKSKHPVHLVTSKCAQNFEISFR